MLVLLLLTTFLRKCRKEKWSDSGSPSTHITRADKRKTAEGKEDEIPKIVRLEIRPLFECIILMRIAGASCGCVEKADESKKKRRKIE